MSPKEIVIFIIENESVFMFEISYIIVSQADFNT